ncbi:MAG: 50S ribosomal protein L23 [Candidatus Moraniibacteriota bacterium]
MAVIEEKKEEEVKAKKVAVKKATKKEVFEVAENSEIAYKVLVEPWITEKSHAGLVDNQYIFRIIRGATKAEVKKAIEGFYKVKVEKISVINLVPKKRTYGRFEGTKATVKKAIITLKEGDKIELFQGA